MTLLINDGCKAPTLIFIQPLGGFIINYNNNIQWEFMENIIVTLQYGYPLVFFLTGYSKIDPYIILTVFCVFLNS